jgi:sugar phosphate permease
MMSSALGLREPNALELRDLKKWQASTFWVMLLGYIGYYLCRANISVALPLLSKEFSYTNTELGIILTASELTYAIGKFINGPLADRVGGRNIFLIGMLGAILFNLLFPLYHSILWFTFAWCGARYFLSMGWGGIVKTIGAWFPAERSGTVMGVISINFQFGGVAGTMLAGFILSLGADWHGLFYYPAGILFLILIWSYFASKEGPDHVHKGIAFGSKASKKLPHLNQAKTSSDLQESVWLNIKHLLKLSIFRQILVFSFITTLLRSTFLFWTPKLLVDIGMGHIAAAFSSAVFPLLGVIGTVLLGWYTDHYAKNGDRARMMWIMLLGLVISLILISILIPLRLEYQNSIIVLMGTSGFFLYGPYSMSSGCLTLDIAGFTRAGSCSGLIDGIGYLGGALSAWGAGYLSDQLGWAQVFYVMAGISLLSVLSAYLMSKTFQKTKLA